MARNAWKQYAKRLTQLENSYQPVVERAIRSQVNQFIAYLSENGVEKATQNIDGVIGYNSMIEPLRRVNKGGAMAEASYMYGNLKQRVEKRQTYGFNPLWTAIIDAYLNNTDLLRDAKNITETTKRRILAIISQGVADGASVPELARLLRQDGLPTKRALLITRTELTGATNFGSMMAAVSTGIIYQKEWLTAGDHRVRGRGEHDRFNHIMLDGQRVEMNQPFVNEEAILFPGMKGASAGNVCNCRCTMLYVPKRDANGEPLTYPQLGKLPKPGNFIIDLAVQTIFAELMSELFGF